MNGGYTSYRAIPKRIDIVGSSAKSAQYVAMAESQLKILEDEMNRSGLNIPGSRTVRLTDGTVIECFKTFDMAHVKVTTNEGGEETSSGQYCWCACHVTIGYVQTSRHACYDMINTEIVYDVVICKNATNYSMIKDVKPMGFVPFYDGQRVMVIFEPLPEKEYIPGAKQGCHMVKCRISNIKEIHQKYYDGVS